MALPKWRVAQGLPNGAEKRSYTVGAGGVTAGKLVSMQDDGEVDAADATENKILGVALETKAAGEEVLVATAMPGVVFSAEATAGTYVAATDLYEGRNCGLNGVDLDATGNIGCRILGLDETDDDSSGTRRVLVSILGRNAAGSATINQAPGLDAEAVT